MNSASRSPGVAGMHLRLSSLGTVLVDRADVRSLRAEDPSGGFGLWPGHADFLTVLGVGVVSWRAAEGPWHHCAVRRGVLTMRRGSEIEIATREAVPGDDLESLEHVVLAQLARRQESEDRSRREQRQLEVLALRALVRPLQPQVDRAGSGP